MNFTKIFLSIAVISAIGCANAQKDSSSSASSDKSTKSDSKQSAKSDSKSDNGAAKATAAGEITCKKKEESRTLRLEALQPKGCNLWYSKHGDKDPMATSKSSAEHCEKVRDKIRKNLETAGYKCE
jgi:hypothetical protein